MICNSSEIHSFRQVRNLHAVRDSRTISLLRIPIRDDSAIPLILLKDRSAGELARVTNHECEFVRFSRHTIYEYEWSRVGFKVKQRDGVKKRMRSDVQLYKYDFNDAFSFLRDKSL